MLLKNISVGVINVDNKNILPQQTVMVSDAMATNVVVKGLIKAGKLEEKKTKVEVVENIVDIEDEFNRMLEEKPTVTKLKRFANEHQIALEDAKTFDEIETVIKAYIAVTKAND